MGRKRTTGCTLSHEPNTPCSRCVRLRKQRSRVHIQKHGGAPLPPPNAERAALDAAVEAHACLRYKAQNYVLAYLRRGTITPPNACERCGIVARPATRFAKAIQIRFWHPNLKKKRDIAWLCPTCLAYHRHSGEELELTWLWPGHAIPAQRGRPPVLLLSPLLITAAQSEAAAITQRMPELGDIMAFGALKRILGTAQTHDLLAQGMRACHRNEPWRPSGDPASDAFLRRWVQHVLKPTADFSQWVEPQPVPERRERRDRLSCPPPPSAPARNETPWDTHTYEVAIGAALSKLDAAIAAADQLLTNMKH